MVTNGKVGMVIKYLELQSYRDGSKNTKCLKAKQIGNIQFIPAKRKQGWMTWRLTIVTSTKGMILSGVPRPEPVFRPRTP